MTRRSRLLLAVLAVVSVLVAAPSGVATAAPVTPPGPAAPSAVASRYLVVADEAAPLARIGRAVAAAGGRVVSTLPEVAVLVAESDDAGFAAALAATPGVAVVGRDMAIGRTGESHPGSRRHGGGGWSDHRGRQSPAPQAKRPKGGDVAPGAEPLAAEQWDLMQIRVTDSTGRRIAPMGDRRVTVALLDSGLDWTHPELAPAVDKRLSRDFRTYDPSIDIFCAVACDAPLGVDPVGHGTAMASLVGAARDGFGMQGVAPGVTLVDLRIGQPDGWVLASPVLNALVYAANKGIDVANLSFSIDPWVFNCPNNAADSTAEQAEQRAIIAAVTRATRYARSKGVTLVAAAGNENNDLGDPGTDIFSPDLPPDGSATRERTLAAGECLYLPAMAPGVVTVGGTTIDGDKSDIANHGTAVDIAAPGPGRSADDVPVVQAISREGAINNGWLDPNTGEILVPERLFQHCSGGTCAWYVRIGGTSDSAAEVSGAAALVISARGRGEGRGSQLTPAAVEQRLHRTAQARPCPATDPDYSATLPPFLDQTAHCTVTPAGTSFLGAGIVDVAAATATR